MKALLSLAPWGAHLLVIVVFVASAHVVVPDSNDDSFIYLRYARQWSEGQGLVYNPGEYVEAFSSPLWMIVLASFASALGPGQDPMVLLTIAQWLSTFFLAMSAMALLLGVRFLAGCAHGWIFLGVSVFLLSPVSWFWARSGMETTMVAFLLTTTILLMLKHRLCNRRIYLHLGRLLSCLLSWSRPEGPILALAIIAVSGSIGKPAPGDGWRKKLSHLISRDTLVSSLAVLLATTLLVGMRKAYYGEWLPNTYYAKMSGGVDFWQRGLEYIYLFFKMNNIWLLIVLFGASLFHPKGGFSGRLLALLGIFSAIVVAESGDFMWYSRFMMPAWPMVVMIAITGLESLQGLLPRYLLPIAVVAGLGWAFHVLEDIRDGTMMERSYGVIQKHGMESYSASVFREILLPEDRLAVGPAGRFVYLSNPYKAYDFWGLVVPEIARRPRKLRARVGHEREYPQAILKRKPSFVLWDFQWAPLTCDLVGERGEGRNLPSIASIFNGRFDYRVAYATGRNSKDVLMFLAHIDALDRPRARTIHLASERCGDGQ